MQKSGRKCFDSVDSALQHRARLSTAMPVLSSSLCGCKYSLGMPNTQTSQRLMLRAEEREEVL